MIMVVEAVKVTGGLVVQQMGQGEVEPVMGLQE